MLREAGIDARYVGAIWEGGRFEILEGARLVTRGGPPNTGEQLAVAPAPIASQELCRNLLAGDQPREQRGIMGVAAEDIQRMRIFYSSNATEPNQIRDRGLYSDCMRSSFRSQRVPYETAVPFCDCTLKAMQTVPDKELNEWFASAQRGTDAPMTQQTWFADLLPKLQACSATE
jgi:hypothetical protein